MTNTTTNRPVDIMIGQISGRTMIELGSWGKLAYGDENTLYMKTTNLGGLHIIITYNAGTDLYDVRAGKMRNAAFKATEDITGVYADQLNELLIGFATKYAR